VTHTLASLADLVGGTVDGDGEREIIGAAGLEEAESGDIAFLAGRRGRKSLPSTKAGAVIAARGEDLAGRDALRVDNPTLAFARILELFHPFGRPEAGIDDTAVIEDGARVDPAATISALCFVGRGASVGAGTVLSPHCFVGRETKIGRDVLLHPCVTIGDRVVISDRVIIHSGTVVGSDGFGYVYDGVKHCKIPQVGGVEIGEDVEIGANVTVDRATTGATRIGRGTKIDNLVQIAHNVQVGEDAVIVAQVGIAGSTRIGNGAMIGGQVAIKDHVTVGDGARLGARSGVLRDVPPGATMSGIGPLPHRQWLRAHAAFDKLPDLLQRLKELEAKVIELEGRGPPSPQEAID
jgi:UDP-3-O-[3-hydroxymyristoyl] glucosamine N-acyltransferase